MNPLTGSQETRNWRTEELLHVGQDLRHQRAAGTNQGRNEASRHGLGDWISRHVVGIGHAVAGETPRRSSRPDLPQIGSATKKPATTSAIRPQ